jgi:cell shape-determining protein MreC
MDGQTITVVSSIVVAVLTSATTLLLGRKKATTDIQQVVNSGFEILIKSLREDVKAKSDQCTELEKLLNECQAERARLTELLANR